MNDANDWAIKITYIRFKWKESGGLKYDVKKCEND